MFLYPRFTRFALALSLFGLAVPAAAQQAPAPAAAPRPERHIQTADDPWLYKGSDIDQDPLWHFGRLPNGLRYVVRNNGVPPGQVTVRVRIDAGSLMETEQERGYAHLLEHLSFRASQYVPDGDSKQIWQRLGVTFGSDSNAKTTFTETVFQLDLPSATPEGLDESFKILAGMMSGPLITEKTLNAERPVVLAEAREQPGAQSRLQDSLYALTFAGQPMADRKPIGTTERLNAATAESVKAFHDRWYRPERAVVVVVGDMDVSVLEAMVVKYFSSWQGIGPAPKSPDFGKPETGHPVSATIVEPSLPPMAMMSVVRPWTVFADTVIFNQKRMVDLVALRIINRRLESRARAGASFLGAGANLDDFARSANVTTVQVLPTGDNWEAALKEVREVIADAQATPPTQAEIDREVAEIQSGMQNSIDTEPVEAGVAQADRMVEAVDINETTTNAQGSYAIFREAVDAHMFNPEAVQAASKRVFEGTALRALLNTHAPDTTAMTRLAAAVNAPVTATVKRKVIGTVSFDQLPRFGPPGTIVSRTTVLDNPKVEKIVFSNGVNLLIHENSAETSKVYVNVRFGRGAQGLPARQSAAWAGEPALVASGIGSMGQEELDALTGNRQIGFGFDVSDDAFKFSAQTTGADLPDQLKLFAAKLAAPAWDPSPVLRAKAGTLSSYAGLSGSPDAVLNRDLDALLHSGDPRWGVPSKAAIMATTPASFRALWEPLLGSGPIEVDLFGDLKTEPAIAAVAATFGALKPRVASAAPLATAKFPAHVATPVMRTHTGQPDQAAAVIAWPTGGGTANGGITESRKLDIVAAIFRDRLLDQLRSQAGVSYSPNVGSDWPVGMPGGGKIMALGLLPPDKTALFFELTRSIAADLVANPVSQDELNRAVEPIRQMLMRRSSGNMFWMQQVEGGAYDPVRLTSIESIGRDLIYTTPAEIQALAAKYLVPTKDWTMVVVPERAKPKAAAGPARKPAAGRKK